MIFIDITDNSIGSVPKQNKKMTSYEVIFYLN